MAERSNASFSGRKPVDKKEKNVEEVLKSVLKVTVVGYGEKRDSRISVAIEKETKERAQKKCKQLGCSLSDAVNQLLYIWGKDKKLPIIRIDTTKVENRTNITLEKTTKEKADKKCKSLDCSLSEVVNSILYIWSRDIELPQKAEPESEPNQEPENESYQQQSLFDFAKLNGDYE